MIGYWNWKNTYSFERDRWGDYQPNDLEEVEVLSGPTDENLLTIFHPNWRGHSGTDSSGSFKIERKHHGHVWNVPKYDVIEQLKKLTIDCSVSSEKEEVYP